MNLRRILWCIACAMVLGGMSYRGWLVWQGLPEIVLLIACAYGFGYGHGRKKDADDALQLLQGMANDGTVCSCWVPLGTGRPPVGICSGCGRRLRMGTTVAAKPPAPADEAEQGEQLDALLTDQARRQGRGTRRS